MKNESECCGFWSMVTGSSTSSKHAFDRGLMEEMEHIVTENADTRISLQKAFRRTHLDSSLLCSLNLSVSSFVFGLFFPVQFFLGIT